jgi:conjugative transfer signal peptidase TraF
MGQPVLTAILALAIAAVLTAAVASGSSASAYTVRAAKLTAIGVLVAVATVAIKQVHLRINFTTSMPIGIYLLLPLQPDGVKRGMLIAACAPSGAAETGHVRGYLAPGPCAHGTELLLKSVVALAGDEVAVTLAGVTVNGCPLPHSRAEPHDGSGRRLDPWGGSNYRLPAGRFWLYAPNNRSWDSRYWGPVSADAIVSEAVPVFLTSLRFLQHPVYRNPVQRQCLSTTVGV